ncbi:type I toxin-antitoxin system Ibs family toxin [Salmonella enterica subsp. enterica serovar Yaba]|nr:type I toxin-antitoxin system Ibs family toxin [Salmonella enterica subsp. enterica serovar Yaba]
MMKLVIILVILLMISPAAF